MAVNNITLSNEQQDFISKALQGNNILVDACIGSGKTTAIQELCNQLPSMKQILYLTYNRLLKEDARDKIKQNNVNVQNYHGFAYACLKAIGIKCGQTELIQYFIKYKPTLPQIDILIIDEYQDIEMETADMLEIIKKSNPDMQIVVVGDMKQKIYDKTTLDVEVFIKKFIPNSLFMQFTQCFRLSHDHAKRLGNIWGKAINGVNPNCKIRSLSLDATIQYLLTKKPKDILCLGKRIGMMPQILNALEFYKQDVFNKGSIYASIKDRDNPGRIDSNIGIFTTYDGCKGMERPICVVCNFTNSYWYERGNHPQQKYDILKNIFLVAASRGKEEIIFVEPMERQDALISDRLLMTPFKSDDISKRPVNISEMFDFKYIEDVEDAYNQLSLSPIQVEDKTIIDIKRNDALIDLSPCVGIYQEAAFFNHDMEEIDKKTNLFFDIHSRSHLKDDRDNFKTLDAKILFYTYCETQQERYIRQVRTPFVSQEDRKKLQDRLSQRFNTNENVQVECQIDFFDPTSQYYNNYFTAKGLADVVVNDTVYELKYVTDLQHSHYLQCACYMVALHKTKGILWNTRDNTMVEISIPDEQEFMNKVTKAITKGFWTTFKGAPPVVKPATIISPISSKPSFVGAALNLSPINTMSHLKSQQDTPTAQEKVTDKTQTRHKITDKIRKRIQKLYFEKEKSVKEISELYPDISKSSIYKIIKEGKEQYYISSK